MNSFVATLSETLTPLAFAGIAFLLTAILQILRKYTLPNIGFYHRKHGQHETFLIRNLDSTHHNKPLSVIIDGQQLEYVVVQAGPWCESTLAGRSPPLRIDFSAVPEDAVFIIRARARLGEVHLRLHEESILKSRHSFDSPIESFTIGRRITYYALRYAFGLLMFFIVFIGSIWFRGMRNAAAGIPGIDPVTTGDISVCVLGCVVSLLAFFLVVPFKGKRTLGGYDGAPIEHGQPGRALGVCWPDDASVIAAFDGSLGIRRKDAPLATRTGGRSPGPEVVLGAQAPCPPPSPTSSPSASVSPSPSSPAGPVGQPDVTHT